VVGRVTKLEITFYSSGGRELGCLRRLPGSNGANEMLWFCGPD
jgi:hypothetical protein